MKNEKPIPCVTALNILMRLDEQSGKLYWNPRGPAWFNSAVRGRVWAMRAWCARYAGTEALSSLNNRGYPCGNIGATKFLAHRVIWKMLTGRDPEMEIDHINRDRRDNRPENLRLATLKGQAANKGPYGASGLKGVFKVGSRWSASGRVRGRHKRIGYFHSPISAALAYDEFAREEYGEFAYLNFPTDAEAAKCA